MFCPKCGSADQSPETYCRQCGQFLPDLNKAKKKTTPAEHIRINTILSLFTMVITFSLAFYHLVNELGRDTPPLMYLTIGFLIAVGCWQVQTFIRGLILLRQLKNKPGGIVERYQETFTGDEKKELNEASFKDAVQATITDRTTKKLETVSSKAEE